MLKEDLAGGRLPSGQFGANAAWWTITVLATSTGSEAVGLGWRVGEQTPEALRFGLISAGRVVRHARTLIIRTSLIRPGSGHEGGYWRWLTDRPDRNLTQPIITDSAKSPSPSHAIFSLTTTPTPTRPPIGGLQFTPDC